MDGDVGVLLEAFADALREELAVDGEGVSGGDGGGVCVEEKEGVGAAHLLLEKPGGGVFGLGFEGVGADELGEVGGLMGLGGAVRAHLVEVDCAAECGGLERGFGTGEASADDFDLFHAALRIVGVAANRRWFDSAAVCPGCQFAGPSVTRSVRRGRRVVRR